MTSQFTQSITDAAGKFDFVGAHFACERNRFSDTNPDGYVNFGSAQNFFQSDDRFERMLAMTPHRDDAHYQPFFGTESCRTSIAGYLQSIAQVPVDADDIVVGNGAVGLLESLAVTLLDEGDACLVSTPVFPGLVAALSLRVKSQIAWLHTTAANDFRLTPEALENELQRQRSSGTRIKAILLCSPGNPIGQVFDRQEMSKFVDIAERFDCWLIVDEIYAESCFVDVEFTSAIQSRSERVFVVGGLSKDFGLAGYATGWVQGIQGDVMRAMRKQAHFYRLPSPVQKVIEVFLDPTWATDHLSRHRRRLTNQYAAACDSLRHSGIKFSTSDAGLCLWLDLREYLSSVDAAGEMKLYQFMLDQHRVHISPGSGFYCQHPGFFRICFSHDDATLTEGLRRLVAGLNAPVPALQ